MTAEVIDLADSRPVRPEDRLHAISRLAVSGLGRGDAVAQEVLVALAVALSDLLPSAGDPEAT